MQNTVAITGTATPIHPRPRSGCAPGLPATTTTLFTVGRQSAVPTPASTGSTGAGTVAADSIALATGDPRFGDLGGNGMCRNVSSDPCANSDGCLSAVSVLHGRPFSAAESDAAFPLPREELHEIKQLVSCNDNVEQKGLVSGPRRLSRLLNQEERSRKRQPGECQTAEETQLLPMTWKQSKTVTAVLFLIRLTQI